MTTNTPATPTTPAPDPITDCRPTSQRLALRFVALQAAHDAQAREAESLRAEVAKLKEKVAWLESELAPRDRTTPWDRH